MFFGQIMNPLIRKFVIKLSTLITHYFHIIFTLITHYFHIILHYFHIIFKLFSLKGDNFFGLSVGSVAFCRL